MQISELETSRLILRQWRDEDFSAFAKLNSDPGVMQYFPGVLSRDESDAMAERCRTLISTRGWGFWATQLKVSGEFIGFIGLNEPKEILPFAPCVEIGRRLARRYWGNGYASEAASRSLSFAFQNLNLREVVSFTAVINKRSQAVMQRIGMVDTGQNFFHPDIAENHPLAEHLLYKITQAEWRQKTVDERLNEFV